jgi:toxin ParE1/3/4
MAYKVVVMPSAQADLEEHADFIAEDSKHHAQQWLRGAREKILSLSENPQRFDVIAESAELGAEIRDVLHYSHRIVYRIRDSDKVVEVLRVWHMARRSLTSRDFL